MKKVEDDWKKENTSIEELKVLDYPVNRTIIDRYVFAANFVYNKTVVDCGCGYGVGTRLFSVFGATEVLGIDKNEKLIEQLITNNSDKNVCFSCEDLENKEWEYKYKKYDVVISLETIEHISPDKISITLNRFKNLCEPNGTIIITTPCSGRDGDDAPLGGGHKYEYTTGEFQSLIEKHFKGEKQYYVFNELVGFEKGSAVENYITTYSNNFFGHCRVIGVVITNE